MGENGQSSDRVAKPCTDQTVGCYQGRPWIVIAIDWVTCRSTLGSWLNVQSGYCKPQFVILVVSSTHVIRWIEN